MKHKGGPGWMFGGGKMPVSRGSGAGVKNDNKKAAKPAPVALHQDAKQSAMRMSDKATDGGANGSHDGSEKTLGGARAIVMTGHPDECRKAQPGSK